MSSLLVKLTSESSSGNSHILKLRSSPESHLHSLEQDLGFAMTWTLLVGVRDTM